MAKSYMKIQSEPFKGGKEIIIENNIYYTKSRGYSQEEIVKHVRMFHNSIRRLRRKLRKGLELKVELGSF